jgi:hypothetical protein
MLVHGKEYVPKVDSGFMYVALKEFKTIRIE